MIKIKEKVNKAMKSKEIILNNAKELFIKKGYSNATMDELCTMAKMSKGNVYHHFKNKQAIYIQILVNYTNSFLNILNSSDFKNANPIDKLLIIAEKYGEDCSEPFFITSLDFANEAVLDEEEVEKIYKLYNSMEMVIIEIIQEGIEKGYFIKKDPNLVKVTVLSFFKGLSLYCLENPNLESQEYIRLHKEGIMLLLEGLQNK